MGAQYKVVKEFSVQELDDNESMVENSEITIPVGSVWEVTNEYYESVKLDRVDKGGWLEVGKEDLENKEYFERVK